MNRRKHAAIWALAGAGILWGLTVPLSKLSLAWLNPAWLTAARFGVAAPLLGLAVRRELRAALRPSVAAAGAVGYGAVILLQNAGIERTGVSDAAVMIGAVPVLVAVLAAAVGARRLGPRTWIGNGVALAGVALVAGIGGGGRPLGDALLLASSFLSAAFVVLQPRMLAGRDAAAVTAVQFGAAALVALPIGLLTSHTPGAPGTAAPVISFVALALAGTLLPFWLFAAGQARVRAETAGAYLNLEPVVGAAVGWVAFGDGAGLAQVVGVIFVLAGIALSTLQLDERPNRDRALRARARANRDRALRERREPIAAIAVVGSYRCVDRSGDAL
jgi:O-acetylserine/cysteine efflux transporter